MEMRNTRQGIYSALEDMEGYALNRWVEVGINRKGALLIEDRLMMLNDAIEDYLEIAEDGADEEPTVKTVVKAFDRIVSASKNLAKALMSTDSETVESAERRHRNEG